MNPIPSDPAALFLLNQRQHEILLNHLPEDLWLAKPPNNTRPIAAIFTHIHNVRSKWIRLNAAHLGVPTQLHRSRCTQEQARTALAESAARCAAMLTEAFANPQSQFRRDALAAPWAAGPAMLAYMLTHEAHHRGQICMLARQLGHPLPGKITSALWNWERLVSA
jgi:uncharacterized damage-inducible protein DinB